MFTIDAVGLFQGHEIDRLLGRNIVTFTMKTQNLLNFFFFLSDQFIADTDDMGIILSLFIV